MGMWWKPKGLPSRPSHEGRSRRTPRRWPVTVSALTAVPVPVSTIVPACHYGALGGRVSQICYYPYKRYPYRPDDGRESEGTEGNRCLRGGAWYYFADDARSAYRTGYSPVFASGYFGFRCVVVPHASPR